MKEQWRKKLQDKMADYQQPAPLLSWDELEQVVAAQQRPAKKVVFYRQRWIAVAAVGILCVGVAVSLLWNPAHLNPQQSSIQTSVGTEKQGVQLSAKTEKQLLSDSQPLLASLSEQHSQKAERLPKESRRILTTDERVDVENTEQSSLSVAATDETTAKAVTETTETIAATASNPTDEQTQPVTSKTNRLTLANVSGRERKASEYLSHTHGNDAYGDSQRLTAQAFFSNGFSNDGNKGGELVVYDATPPADTQVFGAKGPDILRPIELASATPKEHYKHHFPLRFGVSMRYYINNRWSVEAGLSYTRLTADFTRESMHYVQQMEQKLHYVGIPLHVNYTLWNSRRLHFYAKAGGTVEKMVSGRRCATSNPDSESYPMSSEKVTIRPLQLSIDGGIGGEFMIDRQFSIYAEPTVNYHFDNGSKIPTYYQEHPFGFGLTMGLRFNWK